MDHSLFILFRNCFLEKLKRNLIYYYKVKWWQTEMKMEIWNVERYLVPCGCCWEQAIEQKSMHQKAKRSFNFVISRCFLLPRSCNRPNFFFFVADRINRLQLFCAIIGRFWIMWFWVGSWIMLCCMVSGFKLETKSTLFPELCDSWTMWKHH